MTETKKMKLQDIKPAAYNPRVTLQEDDTEYKALEKSINRFGLVEPLVVNKRNNTLIGGHQRYNVLKANGAKTADVVLVDLDEKQEKELNISLNKIEGEWDNYKLEEILRELEPQDIAYTGFSEEEIENIIGLNNEEKLEEIVNEPNEYSEYERTGTGTQEEEPVFDIYLSFPTKDSANRWLEEQGYEERINERLRSATVHMERYDA